MIPQTGSPSDAPKTGEGVRLVADVGGTHVRFAVVGPTPHELQDIEVLRCEDYPRIEDAIEDYVRRNRIGCLREVCMAVAGPMGQDLVDLPNSHWSINPTAMGRALGAELTVINDFAAQALALDALEPEDLEWIGTPRPAAGGARTVVGAGTGLGLAVQTANGEVISSEGGHAGFAPRDEHQISLLRKLLGRFDRVSAERLISGPGLENIYRANRELHGSDPLAEDEQCPADRIARLASEGDTIATRTVHDFFDLLAVFAGDMALVAWSSGGVYLSGGVIKRLSRFLDAARFRSRFEDKGRLSAFCRTVPLARITHDHPGLLGCAEALARRETSAEGLAAPPGPW